MYLKALYLKNFRNYKEATATFSQERNVIYGENAQGKTNLLEAVHLLFSGRSFRAHDLSDLIKFGEEYFYLEAHFEKNGIDQVLKFSFNGKERKIFHNHTQIPTLSALLGILNGVILSPEDRSLIKGAPSERRHFLDIQIAQANPFYLHHLSRFFRAMKQRNMLLRQKNENGIEIWEEHMAESAAKLTIERQKTVSEIEKISSLRFFEPINLVYKASALSKGKELSLKDYFLNQFAKLRHRESELGMTLTGPHRDDIEIRLEEKEARLFASEGQQKCCIVALRLAEWLRLKELIEVVPIMCIDDIGVSLDKKREKMLYENLANLGQVFITSPTLDAHLPSNTHTIQIQNGSIV